NGGVDDRRRSRDCRRLGPVPLRPRRCDGEGVVSNSAADRGAGLPDYVCGARQTVHRPAGRHRKSEWMVQQCDHPDDRAASPDSQPQRHLRVRAARSSGWRGTTMRGAGHYYFGGGAMKRAIVLTVLLVVGGLSLVAAGLQGQGGAAAAPKKVPK